MSQNMQYSGPFVKEYIHSDLTTSGTPNTATQILPIAPVGVRRVQVLIQNQSASASIEVIFNQNGTSGLTLPPQGNIGVDNYNGAVRVISTSASVPIHLAYAVS